ncbi:MAG TPA: PEGA domain-containing protein [Nitrospiraceae bacterium]
MGWWLILVLLLYAYRQHQLWIERTRLTFSAVLQGRSVDYEVRATLDGQPITSGNRISLGQHTFSVSHPKADLFSTNLFVWYGAHDLGQIVLNRGQGTLAIQCSPPAALLTINGPEFSQTATNSPGVTVTVPADHYVVEAKYPRVEERAEVAVPGNGTGSWNFAPRIGNLQVTCNRAGATYQLRNAENREVERGEFPATIRDLPEGNYKLLALHHGNRREESVAVTAGTTKSNEINFAYGTAALESEPAGATVTTADGRSLGVTPLRLSELSAGHWEFILRREGSESTTVSLEITANQTNSFRTNLVSSSYVRAMSNARRYLQAADYDRALEAVGEALRFNKDDHDAMALQTEATRQKALHHAEALGKKRNYAGGITELETVLKTLPDDEEAKQMLADFKKRQEEQGKRRPQEEASRAKAIFDAVVAKDPDASLFESQELTSSKLVKEVELRIRANLQNVQPTFVLSESRNPEPETFVIEAKQQVPGGMRRCWIVGGQTFPDEAQIFFKVVEYTTGKGLNVLGLVLIKTDKVSLVPVHASRVEKMTDALQAQVKEGIRILTGSKMRLNRSSHVT